MRLLLPFGLTDRKAAASLECLVLEAMRATISRRRRCLACMGVRDVRSGLADGDGGRRATSERQGRPPWLHGGKVGGDVSAPCCAETDLPSLLPAVLGLAFFRENQKRPPLVRRAFRRQMVGDTRFELVTPTVSR